MTHTHTYTHTHVHVHVHTSKSLSEGTHTHTYTYTYTHPNPSQRVHTHTYVHVHVHTYTQVLTGTLRAPARAQTALLARSRHPSSSLLPQAASSALKASSIPTQGVAAAAPAKNALPVRTALPAAPHAHPVRKALSPPPLAPAPAPQFRRLGSRHCHR